MRSTSAACSSIAVSISGSVVLSWNVVHIGLEGVTVNGIHVCGHCLVLSQVKGRAPVGECLVVLKQRGIDTRGRGCPRCMVLEDGEAAKSRFWAEEPCEDCEHVIEGAQERLTKLLWKTSTYSWDEPRGEEMNDGDVFRLARENSTSFLDLFMPVHNVRERCRGKWLDGVEPLTDLGFEGHLFG